MLPSTAIILDSASRRDWYGVLGLRPGTRLTERQERSFRAQVHPDKGHPHDVAAAVGQALEALRSRVDARPPSTEVDRLIEECGRAIRCEPLNSAGAATVRSILDALQAERTSALMPRLRYFFKGWTRQVDERCYKEIHRIWQGFEQRIRNDPVRAHEIGLEFLAEAVAIDAFQENFSERQNRIWYAKAWIQHAEQDAERTPAVARHRKTVAQRDRRAERRATATTVSEVDALARVLEHCEVVAEGKLATPLDQLRSGLLAAGLDKKTLLAAGISSKTRRQHRPLEGNSFYYATVVVDGTRVPLRLA
jgi:hypothetical protein